MIRVAIADDQPLFCTGLQMMIESQPDLEFAGSAADGLQAIQLARSAGPDVLLMDIRMPVLDGIAATESIRREHAAPLPRIVVLTTFERDEAVAAALRAGADGFLVKDATPDFILAAIRTVHDGHSVIAPKATTELFRTLARRRPESIDALSVREKEVFLLAARGLNNGEIGQTAFISEATVKSHVRSILAKLGLASRVQLVAFAYENGLVR
ncbi:response regulator transcription factor [Leifsonia sp. 1010]|uniref:response regulator transcription factor n=1 Tax=Leifsonia sp. 1010 TaxID=2817769 RepID=UPI0028550A09|nr:response regulator transcription factor [Leifsonia sp. 1010]MDR6614024.1 DNA-binding NarL/FixJ family response regulator [Leifsonia sp. 1010]